jgi:transketolase
MTTALDVIDRLENKAIEIRKHILELAMYSGGLHVGGDLSMTDSLVALYYEVMKHDPNNPQWEDRDIFVLSKGHGAGGLYTILADMGYFDMDDLKQTYRKLESKYGMHPCKDTVPAGIEMSTGSLGHGLSGAVGIALASRLNNNPRKVYSLVGDGECQEGSIWEAAMSASNFKLNNLITIVDRNHLSLDGNTEDLMALEPFDKKWDAFGWHTQVVNGHNFEELLNAFENAHNQTDRPSVIIADTVKGKGIPFMENNPDWHAGSVDSEMLKECYKILDESKIQRG